jgi:hypothetical protein
VNQTRTLGFPLPPSAIIGLMIVVLGLGACNGPAPVSPAGTLPATTGAGAAPATAPSPTPYSFTFQTVDKPGTDFNRVTGINVRREISGYYGSGSAGDPATGYTAVPPYVTFLDMKDPGSVNTYAMGLSNDLLCVGYFLSREVGDNTLGLVIDHGLFTSYKDHKTPLGPNMVNELLGVNDYASAVGFYTDRSGKNHPYELKITQGKFVALSPAGFDNAEPMGINDAGNIVGFSKHPDGTTEGWIYLNDAYEKVSYPGATSTEALGINNQNQVVGEYTASDSMHGFLVTDVSGAKPIWQSIDEPGAAGTTVVKSINAGHAIAGWYVDSAGTTKGFVATVDR